MHPVVPTPLPHVCHCVYVHRSTLAAEPNSMLARLVWHGLRNSARDAQGRVFIDRDGTHFGIILEYLRDCQCGHDDYAVPTDMGARELCALRREAQFYELEGLMLLLDAGAASAGGGGSTRPC
ncbi:hypothetical protein JKP88DRAFT_244030 [Tribonema minus]|uniref:Potassium channel tetramerisation-type BTB domain-containing protein n=1 Tax=Tribonema minus TaxID=303371 RepID=A0A835ZD86_9STRA|nr:hypothetical protein JKP88DRAFT_244030 [Tribonema minus]